MTLIYSHALYPCCRVPRSAPPFLHLRGAAIQALVARARFRVLAFDLRPSPVAPPKRFVAFPGTTHAQAIFSPHSAISKSLAAEL